MFSHFPNRMRSSSSYKRKRVTPAPTYLKRRKTFVPGPIGHGARYAARTGEWKFLDTTLNDAIVSATGTVTPTVNIIPQGVTESERVGRKCMIKSFHWRYQVSLAERDAVANPFPGDTLRIVLYVDKQCNGAGIATGDLLENAAFHSFRNLSNSGRFTVLMDKLHTLNYGGMASDTGSVVSQSEVVENYTFNKSLNLPIEFSSTTGAIGEIRSNNIGVFLISSTGTCRFDSTIRIRFSDN